MTKKIPGKIQNHLETMRKIITVLKDLNERSDKKPDFLPSIEA
jgi:hypothetical protein